MKICSFSSSKFKTNRYIHIPLFEYLLITLISKSAKILGSVLAGRKELGLKQSLLMGIGLSIRFSTSIIVISVLYQNGLIDAGLYSIIIASSILFKFIMLPLFANLLVKMEYRGKLI